MKEKVTKFDLEAAFKALDEIGYEAPKGGIRPNTINLKETFTKKLKTDLLVEDYYDVGDQNELEDAKAERDEEIAKAKLARIEKIVDLDANSPEELLPSYVGKYIIQCPQCMTLFYKDKEDVEESEDDPNTVNVNETCQHCGNTSGYTLIGKVGEVTPEETANYADENTGEEIPAEETPAEEEQATEEENQEEAPVEEENAEANLDEFDLNLDDNQEEKKEESLETSNSALLNESAEDCKDGNCDIKDDENPTNESLADGHADSHETKIIDQLLGILADDYAIETDKLAELAKRAGMTEKEVQAFIYGNIEESLNNSEAQKDAEKNSELATENKSENKTLNEDIVKDEKEDLLTELVNNIPADLRADLDVATDAAEDEAAKDVVGDISFDFNFKKDTVAKATELVNAVLSNLDTTKYRYQIWSPDALSTEGCQSIDEVVKEATEQDEADLFDEDGYLNISIYHLNESLNEDKRDDDDYYGRDIDDAVIQLKKKGHAEFWCLSDGKKKAEEVKQIVKDKYGKDVEYTITDGYCDARIVKDKKESLNNSEAQKDAEKNSELATENESENKTLNEETLGDTEFTASDMDSLINAELSKPITDSEVQAIIADESLDEDKYNDIDLEVAIEDIEDEVMESLITESLTNEYKNVKSFKLDECVLDENNKLVLEGTITFNSNKTKQTRYVFTEAKANTKSAILIGTNEALGANSKFTLTGLLESKNFKPQSFEYNYIVNSRLIEGLTKR